MRGAVLRGLGAAATLALPLAGQTLERRIAAAPEGSLQFHYAARDGVCGDGRGMLRSDDGAYYLNGGSDVGCQRGPVRVVVTRVGREVLRLDTYAGPLQADASAGTNLGAVPAREASAWLLGQAATLDGRPARDVILPAMLADSSTVTPALLALANDPTRSRDLRRSAISYLARRRSEAGGIGAAAALGAIERVARDQNESETIRQAAVSAISGLDRSEGIPTLLRFAGEGEGWLARQAFATLSRSGDPRARQFMREAVRRPGLTEESRVQAIQGLGGDYSTAADQKMLRDLYATLDSDRQRDAVLTALSSAGGRENVDWLLTLARTPTESVARRRRVLSLLGRSEDPRIQAVLKELTEK